MLNTKLVFLVSGLVSMAGIYALARRLPTPRKALPKEDVKRWENEGGNVPNVPTPRP